MAAGIVLGNAQASFDAGTTWLPAVANVEFYSTATYPFPLQQYWRPAVVELSLSWSWPILDRPSFDRQMLARVRRVLLEEPRSLVAFALERRPELVRRAPRPAGRPSGRRRARKGGRKT